MRSLEITEKDDVLTVKNADGDSLLFKNLVTWASILLLIGSCIWIMSFISFPVYVRLLLTMPFSMGVGFQLSKLFAGDYELQINRVGRTIAIRRRSAFRDRFKVISFDLIASAPVIQKAGSKRFSLFSEIFVMTKSGEKLELCTRQKDETQLEIVAKWLTDSLPALPPTHPESFTFDNKDR